VEDVPTEVIDANDGAGGEVAALAVVDDQVDVGVERFCEIGGGPGGSAGGGEIGGDDEGCGEEPLDGLEDFLADDPAGEFAVDDEGLSDLGWQGVEETGLLNHGEEENDRTGPAASNQFLAEQLFQSRYSKKLDWNRPSPGSNSPS